MIDPGRVRLRERTILDVIRDRHSARVPFDRARPVPAAALKAILEAARWAPTAHNMQNFEVVVVDDPKLLDALGAIEPRLSWQFVVENARQLSASGEELRRKKTGLLASMFPPELRWGPPGDAAGEPHAFLGNPLRGSPLLLVVLYDARKRAPASERDFLGALSLGCVLQNMWLAAESHELGFQVLSLYGGEPAESEVMRLLAIPPHMQIAFAARVGYPAAPAEYLRVRREVDDFTHRNRY